MQETARRGTELTEAHTCPPRGRRHKSWPPASLGARPRERPSRHPLAHPRHPRRRRTPRRRRQPADRESRAVEALVKHSFHPLAPARALAANGNVWAAARLGIDALRDGLQMGHPWGHRPLHAFHVAFAPAVGRRPGRLGEPGRAPAQAPDATPTRGPQAAPVGPCGVPLRPHGHWLEGRPHRGPVASAGDRLAGQTHAGPNAQRPSSWDSRLLAPNGPQGAPVGPCRVLLWPRGPRLEGRPERDPVANVGRRGAGGDSAAASLRRLAVSQQPASADAVRHAATGGHQAAHVGPCRVPLRRHGPGVEDPSERRPVASVGEARDRKPGPARQGDPDQADRLRNRVFVMKCEVPGPRGHIAAT